MIILRLEPHQPRMGEIERDGDAGRVVRAEPFARDPGMRPQPDAALFELVVEIVQAVLQPGALDPDLEVLEAAPEQLLGGQVFPGKCPTRHGASKA